MCVGVWWTGGFVLSCGERAGHGEERKLQDKSARELFMLTSDTVHYQGN